MPRKCSICEHAQRADIDAALVRGDVYRDVARRFACSEHALFRHKAVIRDWPGGRKAISIDGYTGEVRAWTP